MDAAAAQTPEQLLARFGLEHFRAGQREAVEAAIAGRDSLVVMPTGGGKSLCYQLPALLDGALVLVVSPLIALMADQARRLEDAGVPAAMLASGMPEGHNARALARIGDGSAQLVLAAPERFASRAFLEALARRRVTLFVVDEAHCVAEWGHDFRPDYLRLHAAIEALGRPAVMAATATATPRVAAEIAARLELRDPAVIRSGFDRPNITFDVLALEGSGTLARKHRALEHVLSQPDALPGIVYCGTRKDTDGIAASLAAAGLLAVPYHAGMPADARSESQRAFMEGDAQVVVATNAFGMGVDKADVRTVVHWALPTSLEAYYQEAGRAGRDGLPARALLLSARMDLGRLLRFIRERQMEVADVKRYVARLRARAAQAGGDAQLALAHGELDERERVLLSIAERAGAALLAPGGAEGLIVTLTGAGSTRRAEAAIRAARNRVWDAYHSIERYSSSEGVCRRQQILEHFGDPRRAGAQPRSAGGVRCCDVCEADAQLAAALERAARRSVRGRDARAAGARAREAVALAPAEQARFERLRAWRLERAEGKPAYTVATDAALREVLTRTPRSHSELLAIRGIGSSFCSKHGDSLLELCATL